MINLFVSITDDTGDLHNWATLFIEGAIFLPIAYYLASYFFTKEQKENRQKEKEENEQKEKILKKELEDFGMSIIIEIKNITTGHLTVTYDALQDVLKSGMVQEEPLKLFKLNKELLDSRFILLWENYQSKKDILPYNIVNSFSILKSLWSTMNTKYEQEIQKPNPKFNPLMFSMIGVTLLQSLPMLFHDSIKFEDSDRQKQFEKFINELIKSYPFKSSNPESKLGKKTELD